MIRKKYNLKNLNFICFQLVIFMIIIIIIDNNKDILIFHDDSLR